MEYHPTTEGGKHRTYVEAIWGKELRPLILQKCAPIMDLSVHLSLNEQCLPKARDCEAMACDLVRLVQAVAADPNFRDTNTMVEFGPKADLPPGSPGEVFLPVEDWQVASSLASLDVSRHRGVPVPSWYCQNADTAWLGPDVTEFRRILESKRKKAQKYSLGDAPLWLLVVCSTGNDLQSHIFPTNAKERTRLAEAVAQTGFDFQPGPFSEVWLMSAQRRGTRPASSGMSHTALTAAHRALVSSSGLFGKGPDQQTHDWVEALGIPPYKTSKVFFAQ